MWRRRRRALDAHWATYRRNRQGIVGLVMLVVVALVAFLSPWLVPASQLDPATADGPILAAPSLAYPLGTDNFGRPVLGLVVAGARISLVVGLTAAAGAIVIGAGVGIASGFLGRTVDTVLNFVINWFLVIPWIALAIVLASLMGPSLYSITIVIAVTSWPSTARLVRAQVLSVKERPFVERARALGAGNWHLATRHVLPNVTSIIFANAVLMVAYAILAQVGLVLVGLGDPNSISWGTTIEEAFEAGALTAGYWWWIVPPGVAIVITTLSITMCGYALDEILSPQLRDR